MNSIITAKAAVRVLTLCGPMLICGLVGNAQARSDRITFAANGKRVFESIVTLTAQQRVPVGIVIKDAKPLCEKATITLSDATVKEIVDALLIRSHYSAKMVGSVLEIIPDQQPDKATQILTMKFERFSTIPTTPSGVGAILSNYILARLHPEQGRAGSIPLNSTSDILAPFSVTNWSVEEIANDVVSRSPGIWLIERTVTHEPNGSIKSEYGPITILNYKDNAQAIRNAVCNDDNSE